MKLPGWVVDNKESVRREAAEYVSMTPEERLKRTIAVCRAAAQIAELNPRGAQFVRDWRDPLPESTVRALARLRAQGRTRRG